MNLSNFASMDPFMLFSLINMKLRDEGYNLSEFCKINEIDEEALKKKLEAAGFTYNEDLNQFK